MKHKDIALLVVVAFLAGVISLVLTRAIFVTENSRNMTAEIVEPISSQFSEPDKSVFNERAINPTQLIQIGDGNNSDPF